MSPFYAHKNQQYHLFTHRNSLEHEILSRCLDTTMIAHWASPEDSHLFNNRALHSHTQVTTISKHKAKEQIFLTVLETMLN